MTLYAPYLLKFSALIKTDKKIKKRKNLRKQKPSKFI